MGCWALATGGLAGVFHGADMAAAQLIRASRQLQALVPVLLTGLVIGAGVGKSCRPHSPGSSYGLMMPVWRPTMNVSRSAT